MSEQHIVALMDLICPGWADCGQSRISSTRRAAEAVWNAGWRPAGSERFSKDERLVAMARSRLARG